jgi:hypothetical protein
MVVQLKRVSMALGILVLSVSMAAITTDAAPKKIAAARKKQQPKAGAVSRERVVKEFNAAYQNPPDSKKIKAVYTGRVRYYTETRGTQQVPAQAHRVALTVKLTDCGITMRDIWEVYFYKLETEWIFLDILQVGSTRLTGTRKKHPPLDDAAAKKIIADALAEKHAGLQVQDITVLGKKSSWRLCVPEYRITMKTHATMKNEIYNTVTAYECLMVSTLAHVNGKWEHKVSGCIYKGKEIAECHIGTMCRELSADSTIPVIQDAEAVTLLRGAFEREYGLKKNNVAVEKFTIIKRHPLENFGKKAPCTIQALFVIDENRIIPGSADTPRRTIRVRAVYECVVSGYLNYSIPEKKWEGMIESCCSGDQEPCGISCSTPDKGCKRLGEK